MSKSIALVLLVCVTLLTGCGRVPLFSHLSETEANEMMALLLQRDIPCEKAAGKDEQWALKVARHDFARAVELLKAHGYPRDKFTKLGEVFQKSGLVSSPTEERIRYMYALSQEISDTLMRIDGVMNARVHIVIPDNDPLATKITPSSASVFIRYRPGFDLESLTPQLKSLVTRSIEGLNYDNVSLVLIPAAPEPLVPGVEEKTSAPRELFGLPRLPVAIGGVLVLGVAALAWVSRRRHDPKKPATA